MKKTLAWCMAIILGVSTAVLCFVTLDIVEVRGSSMLPGLEEGDKLIVYKLAFKKDSPKYNDIIVFPSEINSPNGEGHLLIKRVIAVEEDTVAIVDGLVFVNDKPLTEGYVFDEKAGYSLQQVTIRNRHCFVLGDNRAISRDSRDVTVGQVDNEKVIGKAVFRIWPLDRIGVI